MLLRLMLVVSVLLLAGCLLLARGCNIEQVKVNSAQALPGGWHRVALDYADVLALQRKATEADNSADSPVHVIEAYSQVVQGTNYCIRFSAAGSCAGGLCQSYECVAAGFRALGANAQVASTSVRCEQQTQYLCDLVQVRESAKNPLPGGWHTVNLDQETVDQLHHKAAQLAAVKSGRVVEAFSAVVVGNKYCIRFESESSANCGDRCSAVSCAAGGYQPPMLSGVRDPINKIAVRCDMAVGSLGSSGSNTGKEPDSGAPMLMSMTSVLMTSLLVAVSAILLH